jgi:hypothetical protein
MLRGSILFRIVACEVLGMAKNCFHHLLPGNGSLWVCTKCGLQVDPGCPFCGRRGGSHEFQCSTRLYRASKHPGLRLRRRQS